MCPSYSDVRLIKSNLKGVKKGGNHSWLVADPGEGPGGPGSHLILDQTEKKLFETASLLSQGLDEPRPTYLKVWLRHCWFPFQRGVRLIDVSVKRDLTAKGLKVL